MRIGRKFAADSYPEPRFGGSGSNSGGGTILVDPDLPSAGNRFRTWAEAYVAVQASNAPIEVAFVVRATPIPIPAGTYDMKGGTFRSVQFGFGGNTKVDLADGAVIRNLFSIESMELRGNSASQASLIWDQIAGEASMKVAFGAVLSNLGSHALIEIPAGGFGDFAIVNQSRVAAEPGPVFSIGDGGTLFFEVTLGSSGDFSNDFVTGVGSTSLQYFHDGSLVSPLPTNAGFSGTVVNTPTQGIGGPTSDRPTGTLNLNTSYFDTTIIPNRTVFWNGAAWVDATGTPA